MANEKERIMLPSYPKVWNLGHPRIAELFQGDIVIEEKIDGSQFSFALIDGKLHMRSHNQEVLAECPEKLFQTAVDVVESVRDLLREGWIYRGEYLQSNHHNNLIYERIPNNNIIIFDVNAGTETYLSPKDKKEECERIGLECVPLIPVENIANMDELNKILEFHSCLGATTIEGIVIKNYGRWTADGKAMMGKYVSEKFKESNIANWKDTNPQSKDIIGIIGAMLKTDARWHKAVQHLAEKGLLTNEPKDIGNLLKELHADLDTEAVDIAKEELIKWAWAKIKRVAMAGFPEWYKSYLAEKQFGNGK